MHPDMPGYRAKHSRGLRYVSIVSSHPSPTVWRMHVRPSSFSSKRRDEQLPERFAIVTRAHYVRSYISEPPSHVSRPRPGRGEGRGVCCVPPTNPSGTVARPYRRSKYDGTGRTRRCDSCCWKSCSVRAVHSPTDTSSSTRRRTSSRSHWRTCRTGTNAHSGRCDTYRRFDDI